MTDIKRWWWLGVVLALSGFIYLLSPILTPFFLLYYIDHASWTHPLLKQKPINIQIATPSTGRDI